MTAPIAGLSAGQVAQPVLAGGGHPLPGPILEAGVPFRHVMERVERASAATARSASTMAGHGQSSPLGHPKGGSAQHSAGLEHGTRASSGEEDELGSMKKRQESFDTLSPTPPPWASPAPPITAADPAQAALRARASASLEEVFPAMVRRVAWSGDSRRGSARLEIGAGELAGATLLVHADGAQVSVHLEVPSGVDARAWQQRISERLAAHGIATDTVEVT